MLRSMLSAVLLIALTLPVVAQEFKVEKVDSGPPADELSPEIAGQLAPTGFKLIKGESRTVCEIWLAKEWPISPAAKVGGDVIYPLTPGQLIGVARYPRKASDFRDQDVPGGVYTLRYGQQPVDGAHVGTSPTRDFLCLLPAAKDQTAAVIDYKTLITASKETAGSAHPAILSLQRPGDSTDPLAIREDADKEWTIVRFTGKTKAGDAVKDLALECVLVGIAAE
ncbi:MAG: hypothetical protein SFU86_13660 [Pirellulaceae bacterium]|nr:hypothetical protein [Pirellulaceae bacterium]